MKHTRPHQEKAEVTLEEKYAAACAILPPQKRKCGQDEAKIAHIEEANAL